MSRSLRRPVLLLAAAGGLLTCGEGPSGATRRVTTVLTSRDSVYLEVGDSVVVRAEARDVNGDAMPEAPITWESLDGAVAGGVTSGATARIFAVTHGVGGAPRPPSFAGSPGGGRAWPRAGGPTPPRRRPPPPRRSSPRSSAGGR